MGIIVSPLRPFGTAGRLSLLTAAAAWAMFSAFVPHSAIDRATTYGAASAFTTVLDLVTGVGLVVAGGLALTLRAYGGVGPLVLLTGAVWWTSDWVGWDGGPTGVRSAGMVCAPFLLPLVAHVAIAFPSGRASGLAAKAFLAVAYAAAAIVSLGTALVWDPFLDQYCWANCAENAFLVRADLGMMHALAAFGRYSAALLGVSVAALCLHRLMVASHVARRSLRPVLGPAAVAGLAHVYYGLLLLRDPAEDPERAVFITAFVLRAGALAALAAGLLWSLVHARRTTAAVARLAEDLGASPAPGSLRAALVRSLGDERLEVAYWLPGLRRYGAPDGRLADPRPGSGQTTTAIVRQGHTVAVVIHDAGLRAGRDLTTQIGAAARLSVDNERLRAEVLAQLAELRASRARIVASSDATRRELERNLHDGAQQRLLAVAFELRLASLEAAEDPALAKLLSVAAAGAQQALAEVRELAQGIFPAVLTDQGLQTALRTLVEGALLPVDLLEVTSRRYPPEIETSVFFLVAEMVADAHRRAAACVSVRVAEVGAGIGVEMCDDGWPCEPDELMPVLDRIGAVGGAVVIGAGRLTAEIPCA